MINKIKNTIKRKLVLFLGVNKLEQYIEDYKHIANGRISSLEVNQQFTSKCIVNSQDKLDTLHNTVSNIVSIGSDIEHSTYGNRSWAVVCIEGKYNVVKFINLERRNGEEILRVLKSFEGGRYVHDTPMAYFTKDMFIDWK